MWLMTPLGFFSIVCKPDDEERDTLTVRSRIRSDLEALRKMCLPSLGVIVEGAGTDYRYRAKAPREEIGKALVQMVMQLKYENFKNEVAHRQGKYRASIYGKVWSVLHNLQEVPSDIRALAYGGVVVDTDGRVLLRRPKDDFEGYVWTFPKGRIDAGETPEQAALREVKEETGYSAKVIRKLSGSFTGGTSITEYFLMSPVGSASPLDDTETSAIRWATLDEAAALVGMTTNQIGQARDLSVLEAVRLALNPQVQIEQ